MYEIWVIGLYQKMEGQDLPFWSMIEHKQNCAAESTSVLRWTQVKQYMKMETRHNWIVLDVKKYFCQNLKQQQFPLSTQVMHSYIVYE